MKVLWITNVLLPEAEVLLPGHKKTAGSGGWLSSSANAIKDSVQLFVATPTNRVDKLTRVEAGGVVYFAFPIGQGNVSYNQSYESVWLEINKQVKPDLVHLHGTEFTHGLAYLNACGAHNTVVSIQGVMSEIAKHRNDGVSNSMILKNMSLYDLKNGTLFSLKRRAEKRSVFEKEILKKVKYVVGRTTFDHAYALSINSDIRYFHCEETLRDVFYEDVWSYETCVPHSIFVSSASYPLKGLHMLLQAMPIILKFYPDTKVVIAGRAIKMVNGLGALIKMPGYDRIINKLIKDYNLSGHITFIGPQDASGIKYNLLKTNLFLSPSSCENSSNSICEAQLLGVPCLASYVGGTPDLIPNDNCGEMYNYYDINTLAYKICSVFSRGDSFDNKEMRNMAAQRNNRSSNAKNTLEIYQTIAKEIEIK